MIIVRRGYPANHYFLAVIFRCHFLLCLVDNHCQISSRDSITSR